MRVGPYRIVRQLDLGVATVVELAEHDALPRLAVIKRLRDVVQAGSAFSRALENEGVTLSALQHPAVVTLYELVKTEQSLALVLEYLDGTRLDALLSRAGGKVTSEVAIAVGAVLADALAHVHERGFVHRDVKPSNVLVTKSGQLKLFDLGASTPALPEAGGARPRASRSDGELAFGTPAYLAPEEILGAEVDGRADVFSLGVVLFELASGERPFGARAKLAVAPPLADKVTHVDAGLAEQVARCLAPSAAERPSASELAASLRALNTRAPEVVLAAFLSEPPKALPSGPSPSSSRTGPGPRRYVVAVVVAALLVLVSAVGLAVRAAARLRTVDGPKRATVEVARLRVLAEPWAEVWVDGKHVETTPFARPLELAAGPHALILRHPDAPEVRRDLVLTGGAEETVDVVMALPEPTSGDAAPDVSAAVREGGAG